MAAVRGRARAFSREDQGLAKIARHLQARASKRYHRVWSENAAVRGQPRSACRRSGESARRVHAGLSGRQPKRQRARVSGAAEIDAVKRGFIGSRSIREGSSDDRFSGSSATIHEGVGQRRTIGNIWRTRATYLRYLWPVCLPLCTTPATFVASVASVATASARDLRNSTFSEGVCRAAGYCRCPGLAVAAPDKSSIESWSMALARRQRSTVSEIMLKEMPHFFPERLQTPG